MQLSSLEDAVTRQDLMKPDKTAEINKAESSLDRGFLS
jgi:hypothetical protein